MLTNWLTGKGNAAPAEAETEKKPPARKVALDSDPVHLKEPTAEEAEAESGRQLRRKLRESAMEKHASPNNLFAYDSPMRVPQRLLMDNHEADGVTINMSRGVHNTMVGTKWQLGNPQTSNWELSLQLQGFGDLVSASYSSMSRWQLMYQKTFTSGALLVAQMMSQPAMAQMGAPAGSFFGLVQYPWVTGGCTALQYVKTQQIAVSHMQRILRNVHIGAQMTYDVNTRDSSMSYVFSSTAPQKNMSWVGEVKPEKGEWRIACTKNDWANDVEVCAQLEYTEKRNGKVSLMSLGMKKNLIGGGVAAAALSGFGKAKVSLELPFGGDRQGFNQVRLGINAMYDATSGGLKHGLNITY